MDDVMTDAGTSRRLREWLHDTAAELPDDPALLGRIRSSIPAAHARRRPSLPWRSLRLVAASVAAVSVVVVAGLAFRAQPESGVGGAVASPSPSALPLPVGSVPPGRYGFSRDVAPLMARYDVSLDVPAGWSNDNGGWVLAKQDGDPPGGATVEVDIIEHLEVDPCRSGTATVDIPSDATPESFARLLTAWGSETGGRTATSPTITEPVFGTFDGRPGVELTVLTPADVVDATCTGGHYTLWGEDGGGRYIQGPGESFRVRAIQVGSELLFLVTGSFPGTPAEVLAEQQAMLDSVRIVARPAVSASPSLKTLPNFSTVEAAARYRLRPSWHTLGDGYEASVGVPAGWETIEGAIVYPSDEQHVATLDLWGIDRVYSDPCTHAGFTDGGPGSSIDRLARSLTAWAATDIPTDPVVTEPRFGEFGGHPGFELTASIPADVDLDDCDHEYRLWAYIDGATATGQPGDELLVRVISVEPVSPDAATPRAGAGPAGLLVLVATTRPGATSEVREQLLAMVDSVRITPVAPGPSPSQGVP